MRYAFRCQSHGDFVINAPMAEGPPRTVVCPECQENAQRVFEAAPDIWHTQGAHKTDYDGSGDRLEKLNKSWSKKYGEKPPPPARDVPRNAKEPV